MGRTLDGPWHAHVADALDEAAVEAAFSAIGPFDRLTHTAVADETALMSQVRDMPTATARRGMEKFWTTFNVAPVRVNLVAPGVVATGVWSETGREGLERRAAGTLPVGRLGTAEDPAGACLATLANRYVTGEVITVDGGLRLL